MEGLTAVWGMLDGVLRHPIVASLSIWFLSLLVIESLTALARWRFCVKVLKEYRVWAVTEGDEHFRRFEWLQDRRERLRECRRTAGLPGSRLPHVEPVGFGKILTANIDPWENWLNNSRADIFYSVEDDLRALIGFFRRRVATTWHPFAWPDLFGSKAQGLVVILKKTFAKP